MFRNLYFQASSFKDFNFSDLLDQIDEVPEAYIEARIREACRGEDVDPYFVPIIPLTLQPKSCAGFIRANPSLPIDERDYYLSKLFQFLYLTIKVGFGLHYDQPEDVRERLEAALDQLPNELLAVLHRFDWWGFCELVSKSDPERGQRSRAINAILNRVADYLPPTPALSPPVPSNSGREDSHALSLAAGVLEGPIGRRVTKNQERDSIILHCLLRDMERSEVCKVLDQKGISTTPQMQKHDLHRWSDAWEDREFRNNIHQLFSKVWRRGESVKPPAVSS